MAEVGERQYGRWGIILIAGCEGGSIWCRHAWRTELGELDCGVLGEPSASAEQADAYVRDTDIILSLPVLLATIVWHRLLWIGVGLFCFGWLLQFVGHAIEGKPPEFLKDWRFLLVGSRWWAAKMRGKA